MKYILFTLLVIGCGPTRPTDKVACVKKPKPSPTLCKGNCDINVDIEITPKNNEVPSEVGSTVEDCVEVERPQY